MEIVSNRLLRIFGLLSKLIGYIFHFIFPRKRFTIPKQSNPLVNSTAKPTIPKILWQTNYSNIVSLPVYLNYLCNRLFAYDFEYRYASNDDCLAYIKLHGTTEVLDAFIQVSDGAAKADFWRVFVLNQEGGVYLDMDANFVWPLNKILGSHDTEELYVVPRRDTFTNYFLASKPGNPILKDALKIIVRNIQNVQNGTKTDMNVYALTGPGTIVKAIGDKDVNKKTYKKVCIQGNFTNEHFQYIDKKNGKWIHTAKEDILK